jgi:diguanylate cyclase (GGDEF)-like protein
MLELTTPAGYAGKTRRLAGILDIPRRFAIPVVIGGLAAVFDLDGRTGSAPVQHLYYLPIVLAGIALGLPGGLVTAFVAIASYHLANPHLLTFRYAESDLVQIALFVAVGATAAKLAGDARRLRRLAMTDDLTGLHNLRSFESRMIAMVRGARRTRTALALLVLDVDRLKQVNDRYGHLAGADAVRCVGHLIARCIPADAVGCRYGGDEFVVAVPGCTSAEAERLADDLREAVHAAAPVLAGVPFPAGTLSVSVGVACRAPDRAGRRRSAPADDAALGEALFRAADAALYEAKAGGRNRVHRARVQADSPSSSASRSSSSALSS